MGICSSLVYSVHGMETERNLDEVLKKRAGVLSEAALDASVHLNVFFQKKRCAVI